MTRISRRAALSAFGAAVVGAPAVLRGRYRVFADSPQEYSARAIRLLRQGVVVDLLNQFRFPDYSERPPKSERWLRVPGSFAPADAAVYHGSGINVFALGDGARDFEEGVRFFADWNGFIAAYPDDLLRVDKAVGLREGQGDGQDRHPALLPGFDALPRARRRGRVLRDGPAAVAADLQLRQPASAAGSSSSATAG